jgi:hypothetical protein
VEDAQWNDLIQALKRYRGKKYVLGSLLLDCRSRYTDDAGLVLVFKNKANLDRLQEELEHPPSRQTFEDAVRAALGRALDVRLLVANGGGEASAPQGHLVRAAVAMGARIIPEREETQ